MARKRIIDPEFWSDEEIGQWSYAARLFYIGLWNFADDSGRFKAHNDLLKAQIFPYEKKIDIDKLKKELNHKIQWYEVEGLQYGYIRNFLKHQRIDRPTDSKLPEPPPFNEPSANPQRVVLPNISKVNISKDKGPAAAIYDYYSKNIKAGAKEDAIKSIRKLLKTGISQEELLGRINAYKKQLIDKPTDFIIQANNFFGEKARYKDFEPVKVVEYKPADPNCKRCKGQGKYLIESTSEIKICECRIK
jgi:hypothetical protein